MVRDFSLARYAFFSIQYLWAAFNGKATEVEGGLRRGEACFLLRQLHWLSEANNTVRAYYKYVESDNEDNEKDLLL